MTVFAILFSLFCSYCNPYWNGIYFRLNADYYSHSYDDSLTGKQAVCDLEYAMKYLKKLHPALYDGIPEDINVQYEKVLRKLGQAEKITINELSREIESIFTLLGDGHTYVRGNYTDRHYLKYLHGWINNGFKISAVNGVPVTQLLDDKAAYYSYEAKSWEYHWLINDVDNIEGLDYLGVSVGGGVEYTFENEDGRIYTERYDKEDFVPYEEYLEFNGMNDSDTTENGNFVSYEIDMEHSLAILTLDSCTYNDEYISYLKEMFTEVKAHGIENVAVDIRNNGGGSSQVINEFLRYLDIDSYKEASLKWRLGIFYLPFESGTCKNDKYSELTFKGDLYLLTATNTFSSAMMFAEYVKDNQLGLIIGEAPGNDPNGYGEIVCFKLPNSQIFMQISTKQFVRADRECTDKLVTPDIECPSEKALEKLYELL